MKRAANTLTTIGDLRLNDVFARIEKNSFEPQPVQWVVIEQNEFLKSRHIYGCIAVQVNANGMLEPQAFLKNETVIFICKKNK